MNSEKIILNNVDIRPNITNINKIRYFNRRTKNTKRGSRSITPISPLHHRDATAATPPPWRRLQRLDRLPREDLLHHFLHHLLRAGTRTCIPMRKLYRRGSRPPIQTGVKSSLPPAPVSRPRPHGARTRTARPRCPAPKRVFQAHAVARQVVAPLGFRPRSKRSRSVLAVSDGAHAEMAKPSIAKAARRRALRKDDLIARPPPSTARRRAALVRFHK